MAQRRKMLEPHGAFRSPVNNNKNNGQVINVPLYPQVGGSQNISRRAKRDALRIKNTGKM